MRQNNTLDYSDIKAEKKEEVAPVSTKKTEEYANDDVFSLKFPKVAEVAPKRVEEKIDPVPVNIPVKEETVIEKKIVPEYRIIGEAFNSYVIVELGDIMYLIDKHAAHERIIFEDLKKKLKEATPSSQMLMLPLSVHLNNEELIALHEYGDEIRKTGFNFDLADKVVSICEIPSEIEISGATDAFATLISRLVDKEGFGEKTRYEFFEKALYQASCKAAIKAGRAYDREHVKWICDRVLTLDNIKYCPHGRPVAFEITRHFLEKQFERIK